MLSQRKHALHGQSASFQHTHTPPPQMRPSSTYKPPTCNTFVNLTAKNARCLWRQTLAYLNLLNATRLETSEGARNGHGVEKLQHERLPVDVRFVDSGHLLGVWKHTQRRGKARVLKVYLQEKEAKPRPRPLGKTIPRWMSRCVAQICGQGLQNTFVIYVLWNYVGWPSW